MHISQISRLMHFAVLAVGAGLILVGLVVSDLAPNQARHWLPPEEYADLQTRERVTHVLTHVNLAIQIVLFIIGGLLVAFSVIGVWAGDTTPTEVHSPGARSGRIGRSLRLAALSLGLIGLALSLWGRSVEFNSFRSSPSVFDGGPAPEELNRERQRADALKKAGVGCVIAAPSVWLVGFMLFRRQERAKPSGSESSDPDLTL
jgi:hypothetical protein